MLMLFLGIAVVVMLMVAMIGIPLMVSIALYQHVQHLCSQLLLILPALQSWSSQSQSALPPFTAALLRG